ncbi:hypothetical protein H0H93_012405, partial [Arthromyces matolae]
MDRPRRSTRQTVRFIDSITSSPSSAMPATRTKRKTTQESASDPAEQVRTLLTSPKSALTTMDIS